MLSRFIHLATVALVACLFSMSGDLVRPAHAQIAENVPAGAFLPQIVADLARLQDGLDSGRLTGSEPRETAITIHWRDGITHVSKGGVCSIEDFVNDICIPSLPLAFGDLGDHSVVWEVVNEAGHIEGQLWFGVFADAEDVVEGGDLVGFTNIGAITGTPFGGYLMFGYIRANTVHWAMYGLASILGEDLLTVPVLEWDWEFLKTGLSVVSGTNHLVVADASDVEYGLIAALVSVAAIGAFTPLGKSLDTMFNTVSATHASTD